MFKKVVCASDFSTCSEAALETAVQIVKETRGELVLLHVWQMTPPTGISGLPVGVAQIALENARASMAAAEAAARKLGAAHVTSRLVDGEPWQTIVASAVEDPHVELIVIGTHGRTGLARLVMGSVAENVVRHATCSVLAVHPGYVPRRFANILCATEFSDVSRTAFDLATDMADSMTAELTLVHVVDGLETVIEPTAMDLATDIERRVDSELVRWRDRAIARSGRVVVKMRTRFGHPDAELLAMTGDSSFDLLVVGCHGRTGMARLVLGSVAEKLVRRSQCPVLVVRSHVIAGEITNAA